MGKPKIRFKGYTEDWEQRKFGEIVKKYEDSIETPTEGYTRLGIRSHAKGTFHSFVEKGKELETAKMFRVAADKFIVNITFGWEHAVAITDENDAGKLVSHRFPQYSFNAGMVPKFFRYLILDENFKHHLELSSPGGAGRNRVLKLSDMLEYKMNFPSEAEQKKIATYFDNIDNLITLHQRKCDETKKLKKCMLQKMFPKEGEKVPEIRFSGFTGDWKQRKLGEIVNRITRKNSKLISELPLTISAQQGLIDQNEFFDKRVASKDVSGYYLIKNGEFAYNKSTSNDAPWGAIKRLDRYENGVLSTLYIVFEIKDETLVNSDFLVAYYSTNLWHKGIHEIAAEGARNHGLLNIAPTDFFKTKLKLPADIEEQKEIGEYFKKIDLLITFHQQKCDELKNIKKFMLQNMFVSEK
ncbi:Restriction endonuclease, type I, HsdS [Anaerobutyricum hallii]|uniref:Restriction endonuclease, type I, HsdS n=1 Tax=Anaerobutyricum hallii TaxID=39488 RepID=A0A285PTU6_9FIRM|nr:restriction endonuclease subunit S [Anaerobutyricum hallii]SOB72596.1 Restriction endonuclease, type I, HsdS [Anaerobutyricum hallii]